MLDAGEPAFPYQLIELVSAAARRVSSESEALSRRPAMNSLYAPGSLLYRSRDLRTLEGNRADGAYQDHQGRQ